MIERGSKPGALAQDRTTLYSDAHKDFNGYRGFSASREQVLGQFRRRAATPPDGRPEQPEMEQIEVE
jgi:hypothetical protein